MDELRASIVLLEAKQAEEGALLKEQFKITYESLKPANLIKNALGELTDSTDFKPDLMGETLSLAIGYLSKKAVVGSSTNPLRKIFGTLLQMGVTSVISNNAEGIKSSAINLINNIFKKQEKSE